MRIFQSYFKSRSDLFGQTEKKNALSLWNCLTGARVNKCWYEFIIAWVMIYNHNAWRYSIQNFISSCDTKASGFLKMPKSVPGINKYSSIVNKVALPKDLPWMVVSDLEPATPWFTKVLHSTEKSQITCSLTAYEILGSATDMVGETVK